MHKIIKFASIAILTLIVMSIGHIPIDNIQTTDPTKIDLIILPSTVHVNDKITYGFVALLGFNNEYIIAEKDISIDITISDNKIISTSSNVIINAGEYYVQFPIYIHSSGEAIVSAKYKNIHVNKVLKVVDDTIDQEIGLNIISVSDRMLINSELLMFISLSGDNGKTIIVNEDIPIDISYPKELISVDDRVVIKENNSHTPLIIKSHEHIGIAYIIATAYIDGKEIKASKTIIIESDRPERLKIYAYPPVLEQGLRSINILVMLLDSNNKPVKADRDIIVNITSSDTSLYILNEKSNRGSFIIKKGESSYYIVENNVYIAAPKKIRISASADGLEGDSTVILVVDPLDYRSKKVKELTLKLFVPPIMSADSTIIGAYQAYTIESDDDDCPYYIEYYNYISSNDNNDNFDDVINRCKEEGFEPHPIDLLNNGEEYPVHGTIVTEAFVTTNDNALRVIHNKISYDKSHGIIELKSYNGNKGITMTVNAQGVGIANTSIEIIDNRYPAATKGVIHIDNDDSAYIYIVVFDHNNRPIIVDHMIYIINPLGIIAHVEKSSFTHITIGKNILHKYTSLEVVAVGTDTKSSLSTTISTNATTNDRTRISILFPFDTFIPVKPVLTGVVQIIDDYSYPVVLNEDINVTLTPSSDVINIPTSLTIEKGRSYKHFNIEILKNKEENLTIRTKYLDYTAEVDLKIILLEGSYYVKMYKTIDDHIEIRIYAQKDSIIYIDDKRDNTFNIIQKDRVVSNRDINGDYYARVILENTDEPLELRFLIQRYGYNDINGSAVIDTYSIVEYTESSNYDYNNILIASFKLPQSIYANEINYLDVIINNINGDAIDSAKIESKSNGLEILNNNVYTNSDGVARIFFRPLHNGEIILDTIISKDGYKDASNSLTLYADIRTDEQRFPLQYYISISAIISIIALFIILFMNKKSIKEEELA